LLATDVQRLLRDLKLSKKIALFLGLLAVWG